MRKKPDRHSFQPTRDQRQVDTAASQTMTEEFSVFCCVTSLDALDNCECESDEGRWTNSLWWDCWYNLLSDMSALSISVANMESENILLAKLIYRNFNQHRSTTVFSTLHKVRLSAFTKALPLLFSLFQSCGSLQGLH